MALGEGLETIRIGVDDELNPVGRLDQPLYLGGRADAKAQGGERGLDRRRDGDTTRAIEPGDPGIQCPLGSGKLGELALERGVGGTPLDSRRRRRPPDGPPRAAAAPADRPSRRRTQARHGRRRLHPLELTRESGSGFGSGCRRARARPPRSTRARGAEGLRGHHRRDRRMLLPGRDALGSTPRGLLAPPPVGTRQRQGQ